jgi:hypothetical protein
MNEKIRRMLEHYTNYPVGDTGSESTLVKYLWANPLTHDVAYTCCPIPPECQYQYGEFMLYGTYQDGTEECLETGANHLCDLIEEGYHVLRNRL